MVHGREMLFPVTVEHLEHDRALEVTHDIHTHLRFLLRIPSLDLFHHPATNLLFSEILVVLDPFVDGYRVPEVG